MNNSNFFFAVTNCSYTATQMWVDVCYSKGSSMKNISGFALVLHCPEHEYSIIQSFTLLIEITVKELYHQLVQDLILLQFQYLLDLGCHVICK